MIKYNDIKSKIKNEFKKGFPEANVNLPNSFIGTILNSFSFGVYLIHQKFNFLIKQVFANTANFTHLKLQAQNRIDELQPTKATGVITIEGSNGVTIDGGEEFLSDDLIFKLIDSVKLDKVVISNLTMINIVAIESLAILTFREYHYLVNNMNFNISNATNDDLNGDWVIDRVIDNKSIQFTINVPDEINEDITPDSDIEISFNGAINCYITSSDTGAKYNLLPFKELESNNADINNVGVGYNGISGGRDPETEEEYRERYLKFLREPQAFFNKSYIESQILNNFPKVTRVFIDNIDLENIKIYVINDNSTDLLIEDSILSDIHSFLFEKYAPINLNADNFIITNPEQQEISITIDNIEPNANEFKTLVKNEIYQYILSLGVGENVDITKLNGFIWNIRDYKNSYMIRYYELLNPTDNITIDDGKIAIPVIKVN